ncbi:MAG: AgmX/PglI C-terminal domain-containing protein [Polyangiales bacterium]
MAGLQQLLAGTVFARDYRVIRPLAEGGMGAVYVAEQLSTGHHRALKLMHPQLVSDVRSRERFLLEARLGSQIGSVHVVEVTAAGVDEDSGTPWLAMELLEGTDLSQALAARGPLDPPTVRDLFDQLGDALGRAHAQGIVHRDLKPENLFVASSRLKGVPFVLKVLDFGIAKIVAEHQTAATVTSALGSPLWMAPEQANRGARVRPATDVWALGLIAFNLLTGKPYWVSANVPEEGFNLQALLVEIMVQALAPASARAAEIGAGGALPPGFDAWFARCVNRDPDQRFADGGQATAALLPLLAPTGAFAATRTLQSPPGIVPLAPTYLPTPPTAIMDLTAVPGTALPPSRAAQPARAGSVLAGAALLGGIGLAGAVALTREPSPPTPAPTSSPATVVVPAERPALPAPPTAAAPEAPAEPPSHEGTIDLGDVGAADSDPGASADPSAEGVPRSGGEVAPTVRAGAPAVSGMLSAEVIRRVVLRNLGQVNRCYTQGLSMNPELAGRVVARFVIGARGEVASSGVGESSISAPSVGECIAAAVRGWQFPSPQGGIVIVSYPFILSPGRAPGAASPRNRVVSPRPSPSARGDLPDTPDRATVAAAMRAVAPSVRACGSGGVVTTRVVFAGTGRVTAVTVPPTLPASVASCVVRAARRITLPPFRRPSFSVNYPYTLQ